MFGTGPISRPATHREHRVGGRVGSGPVPQRIEKMEADYFLSIAREAMWVLALASAPILVPALVSGLILGMVQAATSIQEQTLTFVPKLAIVGVSLVIFGGMIMTLLGDFTVGIFERIPELVR